MKMKIVIVYFIIAYFLQKGYFESSVPILVTSLLNLTSLQMEYCFSTGMCTINTSTNISMKKQKSNCCKTCSCETECAMFGNCCPDLYVARLFTDRKLTKGKPSFKISKKIENLNATFQQHIQETGTVLDEGSKEIQNENFSCVRSKAKNKDFHMEDDLYPLAYLMIASCPKIFKGTDEIKVKCETNYQIKPLETNSVGPDLVVPVTSLKTNYTYKNEYCLLCNEGNDILFDVTQWDVTFISFNEHHYLDDIYEPYSLLHTMISGGSIYGSNLIYQPSNHIAKFVTRCRQVDVKSCPDDTDIDILTVCKNYYLPVFSTSWEYKVSTVYNNIACYLCNNKPLFRANCEADYQQSSGYSMQLNFPRNSGAVSTIRRYNPSEHQLLNISFTEKGSRVNCGIGFFPIYESDSCRLVLCPENFYPVNGSCIPTYHQMANVSFKFVLEVIHDQKLKKNEKYSYYKAYTKRVENILTSLSLNFTLSLWKLTNTTDALLVTITKPRSTYIYLIETLSKFLNKVTFLNINTHTSSIEVVTSLFQDNSKPRLFADKLYTPRKKGKGREVLEILYSVGEISKKLTDIEIDKVHVCYRVKLESSDVHNVDNGIIVLNRTGLVLTFANSKRIPSFGVTTCVDEVNENIEESSMFSLYSYPIRLKILKFKQEIISADMISTDVKKRVEKSGLILPNGIIILIVFASVVILACLSQITSVKRGQRNIEET